ncbi:MAG: YdiU family protein [Acidibacter sp.]|jgi:uncharacterized protein YdiU (UPF0061 family)|nr:YdiU family protein [Acidibacter sp.]
MMRELSDLNFHSRFVDELEGEADAPTFSRQVPNVAYSLVRPEAVSAPRLLAWSEECASLLDLAKPATDCDRSVFILGGNDLATGMRPYAARYGGHQFGNWAGQLGDGRAICLGEIEGQAGKRFELQLKGAGPTPYSRRADGRAVLRSSLREFVCSEAMHALGVPTTRALSLVATGETVIRDMFYDGNPMAEPGAIVCRVAPSFVRFGNFEIHAAMDELDRLRELADFVIRHEYPQYWRGDESPDYAAWFGEICERTAVMISHWMRVGFVHGVMNTDNMSILGLTIDYGPYGWLDNYDPNWTPNTTDASGRRYAYGRQPQIALWNLARLAGALMPLVKSREALEVGLERYRETYAQHFRRSLAQKLGLHALDRDGDTEAMETLFELLSAAETDMTIFFRTLAEVEDIGAVRAAIYEPEIFSSELAARWNAWLQWRRDRIAAELSVGAGLSMERRRERMNVVNPCYVPRNYLLQLAIDAATQGDLAPLEELRQVLGNPYEKRAGLERYAMRRPDWARDRPGCSALSCSS